MYRFTSTSSDSKYRVSLSRTALRAAGNAEKSRSRRSAATDCWKRLAAVSRGEPTRVSGATPISSREGCPRSSPSLARESRPSRLT